MILTFVIYTLVASAYGQGSRREQLNDLLDQELREIDRLSKQLRGRDPNLLLRKAELYLEKARVLKEIETAKYLQLPPRERSRSTKNKIFKGSTSYFINAQKTGLYIIKRFPKFNKKNEVYYILAYNAKEFNQSKKAYKYFKLAIKYSSRSSLVKERSQLALAELLFNEKKFSSAAKIYAPILRKSKDRWWTKDSFNLAQCYYNTKKYDLAISTMKEVYQKSQDKGHVDMGPQALRELALYYATAGRVKEALSFFRGLNIEVGSTLLKLGRHLKDKGKIAQAENILETAKSVTNNQNDKTAANLVLLSLYENFGRVDKHLRISQELLNAYQSQQLDEAERETFKYSVKKMGALLQKQAVSKRYKNVKSVREQKAKQAVAYFNIISLIDGKVAASSVLASAETLFAAGDYNAAIEKYDQSYALAAQKNDAKLMKLSVNGMLASLGKKGIKPATQDQYLVPAYNRFLKNFPKDRRTESIYQKLFTNYIEKNDIQNAEKVMDAYRNRFPRNSSVQEGMLAKVIDHYKKQKNYSQIQSVIGRIRNKEFNVSPKFANSMKKLVLTLQFENVEKLTTKGEKQQALYGYYDIYKDSSSTNEARRNAAYNIAILFHELGRAPAMYKWTKRALDFMTPAEVNKFDNDFLTLTTELFNRRQTQESAELSAYTFQKLCQTKSKRKANFFKNSYVLFIAIKKSDEASKIINQASQCGIDNSQVRMANFDLLQSYEDDSRWNEYERLVEDLSKDKVNWGKLILPLFKLRKIYLNNGRKDYAQKFGGQILNYYDYSVKNRLPIELESLDVVAHYKIQKVQKNIEEFKALELRYPEDTFNKIIQKKFEVLKILTNNALDVLSTGSGKGIVKSYQYLVETYQQFVQEIQSFEPKGVDANYLASFRQSMKQLAAPLLQKSKEFLSEARSQIKKNNILSRSNYWFFSTERVPLQLEYRYTGNGVLMDRGGKK